jgi:hypothetical protein
MVPLFVIEAWNLTDEWSGIVSEKYSTVSGQVMHDGGGGGGGLASGVGVDEPSASGGIVPIVASSPGGGGVLPPDELLLAEPPPLLLAAPESNDEMTAPASFLGPSPGSAAHAPAKAAAKKSPPRYRDTIFTVVVRNTADGSPFRGSPRFLVRSLFKAGVRTRPRSP